MQKINEFRYFEEEKISIDLKCAICTDPLFMPVSHSKCGVSFCKACVSGLVKCPTCRENTNASNFSEVPIIIRNLVNTLKVYCPNCEDIFERGNLQTHLKKCDILCQWGCGIRVAAINQKKHEELECANFIVKCKASDIFCFWEGKRSQYEDHCKNCPFLTNTTIVPVFKKKI